MEADICALIVVDDAAVIVEGLIVGGTRFCVGYRTRAEDVSGSGLGG